MTEIRLTDKQEEALEHTSNVVLVAGAGSGKTMVLTRRYLDILEANPRLSVRNILAITFTDRAAAEMLARIREMVAERCSGADAERWKGIREELMAASISTIHAFCASLLRSYAPEAELDPDFDTLDGPSSIILLEEAIAEATDPLNSELHEELRFLWRRWSAGQVRDVLRAVLSALEVSRDELLHVASSSPDDLASGWAGKVSSLQSSIAGVLVEQTDLLDLLQQIESAGSDPRDEEAARFIGAVAEARSRLECGERLAETMGGLIPFFITNDSRARRRFPGNKQRWSGGDIGVYKSAAAAAAQLLAPHASILTIRADYENDRFVATHLRSLAKVACWALASYEQRKKDAGGLDFTDLQARALELLESNAEIRQRVRARYRYVMVDEFQDINAVQWGIVRLLVSDGQTLARDKLFIVGDPLQSIYGFRRAEVELLEKACDEMRESASLSTGVRPKLLRMDENFRSHPNIIRFNNLLFQRLFQKPRVGREAYEPDFQLLRPERPATPECGSVEVLAALRSPEMPVFAHEAACIAARIHGLTGANAAQVFDRKTRAFRKAGFGDIAILLRGRTHLGTLERVMRAAGVPYVVAGGIGFFGQEEVTDLISFLRFLASPWHDIGVAAMLRSPLLSVTDEALLRLTLMRPRVPLWDKICKLSDFNAFEEHDADALRQMRGLCGELLGLSGKATPGRLIHKLLDETGAWGSYAAGPRGHQAIANIYKFLTVLRRLNSPSRPLPDLVRVLDLHAERGVAEAEAPLHLEDEDAVRIMTIHAAKGLEFPIVFLADLGRQMSHRQRPLVIERELGFGLALPSGGVRDGEEKCSLRVAAEEQLRRRERAEEQRLLYVAATRARDHLVFSGEVKPKAKLDASASSWMVRILTGLGIKELTARTEELTVGEEFPATFRLDVVEAGERSPAGVEVQEAVSGEDTVVGDEEASLFSWLEPLAPASGRRELSVTALAEYLRCPRAYYLSQEMRAGDLREAETEALARGSSIHRVFQLSYGKAEGELQGLCGTVAEQVRGLGAAERERLRREALDAVGRAQRGRVGELSAAAERVLTEVPINFNIGRATLNGVIDRLCIMPGGEFAVIDFKTDRIESGDVAERTEEYKIQLDAYALGVSRAFAAPLSKVGVLLYFTTPGVVKEWRMEARDAEALGRQLEEIADRIARGKFPAAPSEECEACAHWKLGICRARGAS